MSQDLNHFNGHKISNWVNRLITVLSVFVFFTGCSQLPIKVAVDDVQASSQVNEEGLSVVPGPSEQKREEAEAQRSPFDLNLNLDDRKQSELDSALKRLIKDLETAMLEANEGIDVNEDGTYLVNNPVSHRREKMDMSTLRQE